MPELEQAICARLRLWRENLHFTRAMIAEGVGMTAESFANYELSRAPLRYGLVSDLASRFPLNPGWLATGKGPQDVQVFLPSAEELNVSPRDLFSEVFTDDLSKQIQRKVEQFFQQPVNFLRVIKLPRYLPINGQTRAHIEEALTAQIHDWVARLPDSELVEFTNRVLEFADQLFASAVFESNPEHPSTTERRQTETRNARLRLRVNKMKRKPSDS